jgi:xanthine dehydrogenase accessory factor
VGTLMAVNANGDVAGSISGGCFDAAVIAEAKAALVKGKPSLLRLGAGSPWIDIKLPCGGGIELLIIPNPAADMIAAALDTLAARAPCQLELDKGDGTVFQLELQPRLRLLVAGNGGEVMAIARLAHTIDQQVVAISPDIALLDALDTVIESVHLKTPEALDDIQIDAWTAAAVFFHDHDWEPPFLAKLLASDAYFIGAMGSLTTHMARRAALISLGLDEAVIDKLASPLGLFAPARDPQALAISALAQIVALEP